ncbi:toll/interleukin-1 receptor domain-containing protein [Rudaea sp.]|uniref:toll/interleukin-1 receptor domain-containing protein n=1 Tax=Rudaea sp. TaxID=2136325 RepID=UPI003784E8C2
MLMRGAQVIVRWQDGRRFRCESWEGLAVQNPALITLAHCGTSQAQRDLRELRDALVAEMFAMGATQQAAAPCGGGSSGIAGCHAEDEPDCQKVLVMVGDGHQAFLDQQPALADWAACVPTHVVLPVAPMASKPKFSTMFPTWVGAYNAAFWSGSPAEAVPPVLGVAGITAELPKIFISYRQAEAAGLAIQIFDALGHAGFDVFLDHFRIPPGVNFQARLTEQLGDKSMVLFLESDTFLQSPWVTYEVNVAKTCGLGLHALNLCDAPPISGVDEALRTRLAGSDFVGAVFGPTAVLAASKLSEVVSLVRREHDRAIVRRRKILEATLEGAILGAGGSRPIPVGSGTVQINAGTGSKTYIVSVTPRPPDLPDFHRVHGQATHPTVGVVIGLSQLMEPGRHARLSWLAGVSTLKFCDEGDMLVLGHQMVQGSL